MQNIESRKLATVDQVVCEKLKIDERIRDSRLSLEWLDRTLDSLFKRGFHVYSHSIVLDAVIESRSQISERAIEEDEVRGWQLHLD